MPADTLGRLQRDAQQMVSAERRHFQELNSILENQVARYTNLEESNMEKKRRVEQKFRESRQVNAASEGLINASMTAFNAHFRKIEEFQQQIGDELGRQAKAERRRQRFEEKLMMRRRQIAEAQARQPKRSRRTLLLDQIAKAQAELTSLNTEEEQLQGERVELDRLISELTIKVQKLEEDYEQELATLITLVYNTSGIEDRANLFLQAHALEVEYLSTLGTVAIYDVQQFSRKQNFETLHRVETFYNQLTQHEAQTDQQFMQAYFDVKIREMVDQVHVGSKAQLDAQGIRKDIDRAIQSIKELHGRLDGLKNERLRLEISLKDFEAQRAASISGDQYTLDAHQRTVLQIRLKIGIIIKKNLSLQHELHIYRALLEERQIVAAPRKLETFKQNIAEVTELIWEEERYEGATECEAIRYQYKKTTTGGGDRPPRLSTSLRHTREEFQAARHDARLSWNDFVKVLHCIVEGRDSHEQQTREAFDALDLDNSGSIDKDELLTFMRIVIPSAEERAVARLVRDVVAEGDKIDYDGFRRFITKDFFKDFLFTGHI